MSVKDPARDEGTTPAGRAQWLAGGLWSRSRKHEWSRRRYAKRSRNLARIAVGSAVLSAIGGAVTVVSQEPWLGVISVIAGAVAAGVKGYEERIDPHAAAEAHGLARRSFEILHGRYKNFYELEAPRLTDEKALAALTTLEKQREDLRHSMIDEEEGAEEAT